MKKLFLQPWFQIYFFSLKIFFGVNLVYRFLKLIYIVCMYVNKKQLVLIFCTKYCFMNLNGKKHLKDLLLNVQFFVRAECFAYVPARAQAIGSILLGSLGTLVFTIIYVIRCYFFKFPDLLFLSFSQGKIRTPKKSGTTQTFSTPER